MIKLEFSHNGKKFNDIEGAMMAAARSGVEGVIGDRVKEFQRKHNATKGRITVKVSEDLKKVNYTFSDSIPEALIEELRNLKITIK